MSCWFIASRQKMRILKLLFQDPATEGGIPRLYGPALYPALPISQFLAVAAGPGHWGLL